MRWFDGGLILTAVGILLRRVLRLDATGATQESKFRSLSQDRQAIYHPLEQEIQAHIAILGITLNEAFGEREEGRYEMAWHMMRLAAGEWVRLGELLLGLLGLLSKFLPSTSGVVPVRRVAAGHFKSRSVIDSMGLYEFLDQVLFNSKRRFALQLRVLHRASTLLSKEFQRACREGRRSLDPSDEMWARLDCCSHDFELIAKEMLLAFRTLLACQSPEGVPPLATDLYALLERGVRVSVSPANQQSSYHV